MEVTKTNTSFMNFFLVENTWKYNNLFSSSFNI